MEKNKKVMNLNRKIVMCFLLTLFFSVNLMPSHGISIEENNKDRYDVKIEKPATDKADGSRIYISRKTGKIVFREVIPMTGHKWSAWKIAKKATYSKDGYKVRYCLKHPHVKHVDKKVLIRTGPKWGKWIIDRNPTNNKDGLRHREDLLHKGRREYEIIPVINIFPREMNILQKSNIEKRPSRKDIQSNPKTDSKENSQEASEAGSGANSAGRGQDVTDVGVSSNHVPFGAADAAIVLANGTVAAFWWILLLPLVKVMFWIARKRREAEEKNL